MNIGDNIRNLRKLNKLSQKELAKDINMSQQAITSWEVGRTSPPPEMIKQLAEYFNVTTDHLINGESKKAEHSGRPRGVKIPVMGNVAAGIPIEAIENIDYDDPDGWEEIPEQMAETGDFFALRIKGDSMEPKISNGDIVIVRVQQEVKSGELAIVLVNGDEATCKKIKITPDGIMLIPFNPAFEPMVYSKKEIRDLPVQIIGRVVELRAKF